MTLGLGSGPSRMKVCVALGSVGFLRAATGPQEAGLQARVLMYADSFTFSVYGTSQTLESLPDVRVTYDVAPTNTPAQFSREVCLRAFAAIGLAFRGDRVGWPGVAASFSALTRLCAERNVMNLCPPW